MRKAYDSHCAELAALFLEGYKHDKDNVDDLAWAIQDTIDTFLADFDLIVPVPSDAK